MTIIIGQHEILPVLKDWSPFDISSLVAGEACLSIPQPRLARQRVRLVLFANHDLSQFDDFIIECHGQVTSIGISRIGNCRRLIGNVCEGQVFSAPNGYRQREISLYVGDNSHAVLIDSNTNVLHAVAPLIDDMAFDVYLPEADGVDKQEHGNHRGLFQFVLVFENVGGRTVESLADGIKGAEADGLCLACLEL